MMFNYFFCSLKRYAAKPIYFFIFLFLNGSGAHAQFTAGNLVVLQAGNGVTPLANTGNMIVLREFNQQGAPAYSVAISSTVNPLVVSGSATSEGGLSLSPNGKYLVFAGYAVNFPYANSLSGSTASSVNRGVGIVDAVGSYSRITTSTTFYSGNSIRSATSDGLHNYWTAGGNNGTNYFGTVASSVTVQNANTNTRNVLVNGGDLYFSTGAGTQGVYRVGNGLPVTSGQSNSLIINTSSTGIGAPSGFAFYFNAAQTLCYIADDRSFTNGGGIQKWVYANGAWSLAYVLNVGGSSGARGVVVDFSGANPKVYATTDESSANRLVAINDVGAASTATTLATATPNSIFRGLAFSPFCLEPQITAINTGAVCMGQSFTLSPNISGTAPLSYTWTGPASFSSSVPSPTQIAISGGVYSLSVANACGIANETVSVSVNPMPVISVSAPFICPGGTVVLTANGASTYTWNTLANSNTVSVSPLTTTNYTVTGMSLQGCVVTQTTSVGVTNSLVLAINSVSTCPGIPTTLTMNGAYSYTVFSPQGFVGITQTTININPVATVTYSVVGSAPGCVSEATTSASVFVNSLPTITVNSATVCAGKTATLAAYGGMNYTWNTTDVGPLVLLTPTVTTGYTVTGSSGQGCLATAVATVVVNPNPTTTLSLPSPTVCMNAGVQTLTGTPQGGFFAGPALNADQFNPAALSEGTFVITYKYTDANSCEGTDSETISVVSCTTVALEDQVLVKELAVYPVPAKNELHIVFTSLTNEQTLEIINLQGLIVNKLFIGEKATLIELDGYVPGIYFVKITSKAGSRYLKFIKE